VIRSPIIAIIRLLKGKEAIMPIRPPTTEQKVEDLMAGLIKFFFWFMLFVIAVGVVGFPVAAIVAGIVAYFHLRNRSKGK
jgi:small-conductance mechanosensitive channel